MSRVAVAGAGLTGCLLAVRLARAGHEVELFDRRPDLRVRDVDAGRSINLAISTRGLDALRHIGIDDVVLDDAIKMPGRIVHDEAGDTTFQPYGTEADHVLHSVNRDALNMALLDAVDATAGISTRFEHRVRDLSIRRGELTVDHHGDLVTHTFDVVYGCDGAYSAIRGRLQRIGRIDFSQEFLDHGYKEVTIPAAADGSFAMDPHGLHVWPRGEHMMIALPNPDGSFTGTLFWPYEGATSFDSVLSADDAVGVFRRQFPDALELIDDVGAQYVHNPTSSLVTMRTGPWFYDDKVLILGDAAHAVVPFLGQGANAALEDVTVLMDLYDEKGHDAHAAVFEAFYERRKPDADALADLAIEHYVEMRDTVSSRWFLLGKAMERIATRAMPSKFVPLYTMVSFTRTPYAEAVARAERQAHMARLAVAAIAVVLVALIIALVLILGT